MFATVQTESKAVSYCSLSVYAEPDSIAQLLKRFLSRQKKLSSTSRPVTDAAAAVLFPCCHMDTAIKHPVPDRIKPSFVIFDIRAL